MEEAEQSKGLERLHLRDVGLVFHRYLLLFLAAPLVCAGVGAGAAHLLFPVSYQASVKLMVAPVPAGGAITYDRMLAAEQLAATDAQVLKSNRILQQVKKNLHLPVSAMELSSHISVQHIQQTGVLFVSVDADTPGQAVQTVRELSEVATDSIARMDNAGTIQTISDPEADSVPHAPNLGTAAGICYAAGWAVAIFIALFHANWRKGYGTAQEVEERTGLPVLGVLPHAKVQTVTGGGKMPAPLFQQCDPMPLLSQNVLPAFEETCWTVCNQLSELLPQKPRRVLLASALRGEGRTTVAVNLAVILAQKGMRVLLLETDFRHPVLSQQLHVPPPLPGGLAAILENGASCTEQTVFLKDYGFFFVPVGMARRHPMALIGSPPMEKALDCFSKEYDWIIMDSPPVCQFGDASVLGCKADGALLVIRQWSTPETSFQTARDRLARAGVRILGCILNDCTFPYS